MSYAIDEVTGLTTPNTNSSLRIGLLENSCHSLKQGYGAWNKWQAAQDKWLLKEAVIWVHHGIELALKQLLVQTNDYLVFENVDKAVEELARLRGKGNAAVSALDLFEEEKSITTVGFQKLIDRCAVMLNLADLTKGAVLRSRIDELTKYRNKTVHFQVEIVPAEVSTLLSDILDPLLSLLS